MASAIGDFEDIGEFNSNALAGMDADPTASASTSAAAGGEEEWASNPLMSRSAATADERSAHVMRQRAVSKANPLAHLSARGGGGAEDDDAEFASNPLAGGGGGEEDLGAELADGGDDDADFSPNPLGGNGDDLLDEDAHGDLAKGAGNEDAEFVGNAVAGVPSSSRMDVLLADDELEAAEEAELAKNAIDMTPAKRAPMNEVATAGAAPAAAETGNNSASSTTAAGSAVADRTTFTFDLYVFLALFVCTLFPFLGLPLYERYLSPELARRQAERREEKKMDKILPDVAADSDDEDQQEEMQRDGVRGSASASSSAYRPLRASPDEPRSPRRLAPLATFAPSSEMVRASDDVLPSTDELLTASSSSSSSATASSGPYFAWNWPSAWLAVQKAAFPWLEAIQKWWNAEADKEATVQHIISVLKTDKRYLLHPMFLPVARKLLVGLSVLLMLFLVLEDVHLSLQSALLYALRFYVCAVAAFAALGAVHSEGLVDGYKAVQNSRDRQLEKVHMKFVMLPMANAAGAGAGAATASSAQDGKLHSSNALQLLRSIDSLSKANKPALLERRMVFQAFVCTLRALVGVYAAWSSGSAFVTAFLYGIFHLASGFFFFAMCSQTEFELHDDHRRWHVFSAIHSPSACRKRGLPFYIPLAHLGSKSNNIQGWYAIRCYLKDLKGKFDFARVQVLLACVFVQLATCALLPLSYSYFILGHSLPRVYAHVIADNPLVCFDVALCLSLLLDLVAAGVAINRACGSHSAALQEEEMQRSFALTNPDARVKAGGEQAVVDSIAQLKALRERLSLCRETEKLRVYGVALDEHIITYLRTALVSYGVVFAQSFFSRAVMHEPAPLAKI